MAALTTDELHKLDKQMMHLKGMVIAGSRSLAEAKAAVQAGIDGQYSSSATPGLILDLRPHFDPQRVVDGMKALNKARGEANGWKFGPADFSRLPDPPAWPIEARIPAVVLCANLDTVGNTFNEACIAAKSRQAQQWDHQLDQSKLELRFAEFEPNILWWEAIDLGANWEPKGGRCLADLTDPNLAHVQVLWAAEQYPVAWVQAQDGRTVPFADMGGYLYAEACAPYCRWHADLQGLRVNYDYLDNLHDDCAAPRCLRD